MIFVKLEILYQLEFQGNLATTVSLLSKVSFLGKLMPYFQYDSSLSQLNSLYQTEPNYCITRPFYEYTEINPVKRVTFCREEVFIGFAKFNGFSKYRKIILPKVQ